ncbi:MAG: hypothetical protein HC831_15280 [Chloroflexia bacterium]|nr:hypothetical protein [Chloroflexia bacterium]
MEDWEMWLRIAHHYKIAFLNEVLVEYRVHSSSTTSRAFINGEIADDFNLISQILTENYGISKSSKLIKKRNLEQINYLINNISDFNSSNKKIIYQILKLNKDPKTIFRLMNKMVRNF